MKQHTYVIYSLLLILILGSCIKDEVELNPDQIGISPVFGLPVGKVSLVAEDIIREFDEDNFIETNDDGLVVLTYSDSIFNFGADAFYTIPDQFVNEEASLSSQEINELYLNGEFTYQATETISLDLESNDILDSIRFHDGNLSLEIDSDGEIAVSGSVRILYPNGSIAEEFEFVDNSPPVDILANISLANTLFIFENGSSSNSLNVEVIVNYDALSSDESTFSEASINLSMTDLIVQRVAGYLAPREFELDTLTTSIDFLADEIDTELIISDPELRLFFSNGFGIEVEPKINEIIGINYAGEINQISGDNYTGSTVIEAAQFVGDTAVSELIINNGNISPSITEFIGFKPSEIEASMNVLLNPLDEPSSFIDRDSHLDVSLEARIPIFGSVSDLKINDTTDVELGSLIEELNENENIEWVEFKTDFTNGFPVDLELQVVFLDSLNITLDSLFTDSRFELHSGLVDNSLPESHPNYGKVIQPTTMSKIITITREDVLNLEEATQAVFIINGSTFENNGSEIKLFSSDQIEVQLAGRLKLNL